jgi:hypothetical protein
VPRGPRGEKRPGDVIGAAIMVAKIATQELEDTAADPGKEYARRGGLKGGPARAAKLTPEERKAVAKKAAAKRWKNRRT